MKSEHDPTRRPARGPDGTIYASISAAYAATGAKGSMWAFRQMVREQKLGWRCATARELEAASQGPAG